MLLQDLNNQSEEYAYRLEIQIRQELDAMTDKDDKADYKRLLIGHLAEKINNL